MSLVAKKCFITHVTVAMDGDRMPPRCIFADPSSPPSPTDLSFARFDQVKGFSRDHPAVGLCHQVFRDGQDIDIDSFKKTALFAHRGLTTFEYPDPRLYGRDSWEYHILGQVVPFPLLRGINFVFLQIASAPSVSERGFCFEAYITPCASLHHLNFPDQNLTRWHTPCRERFPSLGAALAAQVSICEKYGGPLVVAARPTRALNRGA